MSEEGKRWEEMDGEFVSHEGKILGDGWMEKSQLVIVYLCVEWCKPCRAYTDVLVEVYRAMRDRHSQLVEVVQASFDSDVREYEKCVNGVPWVCLPFGDARVDWISKKFDAYDVPCLLVFTNSGELVSNNAREEIDKYGIDIVETWIHKTMDRRNK